MSEDFLPILGYDHLEFYVGNAKQSAYFYDKTFGFQPLAKSGLQTGVRDRASYVVKQGNIHLVLTCALTPDHEIARHCALHGDGVKAIGLRVEDVDRSMAALKQRGATIVQEATSLEDKDGTLRVGAIKIWGDTIMKFVERRHYRGVFAPGFAPIEGYQAAGCGLAAIDHVVGNVPLGMMNYWARHLEEVMGFSQLLHF